VLTDRDAGHHRRRSALLGLLLSAGAGVPLG
jgi:hypothetical protein